MITIYRYW